MPDSERSMSTTPWERALATLRAVINLNEDTSLDEDLLARISAPDFDATDAAREWVAHVLPG